MPDVRNDKITIGRQTFDDMLELLEAWLDEYIRPTASGRAELAAETEVRIADAKREVK